MLKMRDLHEVPVLFELLSDPDVYPYVRQKADTSDGYYFVTKQIIEAEENGELISRTILDEYQQPIGTINLLDIQGNFGFLATWIGKAYFGKGYNKLAKEQFLQELFIETSIETVFLKVRNTNARSFKAVLKLPYAALGNDYFPTVYNEINTPDPAFDLFAIQKEHFLSYLQFTQSETAITDEEVS